MALTAMGKQVSYYKFMPLRIAEGSGALWGAVAMPGGGKIVVPGCIRGGGDGSHQGDGLRLDRLPQAPVRVGM